MLCLPQLDRKIHRLLHSRFARVFNGQAVPSSLCLRPFAEACFHTAQPEHFPLSSSRTGSAFAYNPQIEPYTIKLAFSGDVRGYPALFVRIRCRQSYFAAA